MLGCKWSIKSLILRLIRELIDTCWDVNADILCAEYAGDWELIDTCWDVNTAWRGALFFVCIELIDTCWDVNPKQMTGLLGSVSRINRYMLGCKYNCMSNTLELKYELIDTCCDVN